MKKPLLMIAAVGLVAFLLPKAFYYSSSESSNLEQELDLLRAKISEMESKSRHIPTLPSGHPSPNKEEKKDRIISKVIWEPDGSHKDDPYLGDGNVVMMAFTDHQCAPCKKFYRESFSKLKENYFTSHAKFLLRDFPLRSNNLSREAAQAAHCAGEQGKYWEMAQSLAETKKVQQLDDFEDIAANIGGIKSSFFSSCLTSRRYRGEIERDIAEGESLGAKGAPGFFIGKITSSGQYEGIFVRGAQPYVVLSGLLDRYLETN